MSDDAPGLTRRRTGRTFAYVTPRGAAVRALGVLQRVRSLAIPPAWTDVWICADANGHLQATGRDARGRKQYRYHPAFREARDLAKYRHLIEFAHALPRIRAAVARDMRKRSLSREKVIATVVYLLEATLIRVGNADYARQNKSYGLTTMRDPHVQVNSTTVDFAFTGKSGRAWRLSLRDKRVARIVKACRDLPGPHLFQYQAPEGCRAVTSADVNAYLREVSGFDVTAKDFRTWAGTLLTAHVLAGMETPTSEAMAKRVIRAAVTEVAQQLGNTVAVCRKSYVHPAIVHAYTEGALAAKLKKLKPRSRRAGLAREEAAVLAFLQRAPH